jgi:hypothetical protein
MLGVRSFLLLLKSDGTYIELSLSKNSGSVLTVYTTFQLKEA